MPYHLENALASATKALTEAVRPAVDEGNPLAREQLELVINLLGFLGSRVPLLAHRSDREAADYRSMASAIVATGVAFREPLAGEIERARSCGATPAAIARAAAACSDAARVAADLPEAERSAVERAILDASRAPIELGRSWFEPFGFDRNPVTPLATLLQVKGHNA